MGIFGAMTTAITGLRAQSTALEHISNNIANSQTTGFKRTDTSFAELVPNSPPRSQALGVVQAFSRPTNTVQGDISNSDVSTFVAINGDGYFIVGQQTDTADGNPVFSDESLYTRRGDFELDRNGFLVNGAGYFLKGLPIDQTTGNVTGSLPNEIQISNDLLPAQATTQIDYRANLPSFPLTATSNTAIANSELINPASFANDPTTAGTGVVTGADNTTFIDQSISGGAVTAFDSSGQAVNVQLRWAKTDSVANGGADTWNLFYLADSTATGATTAWVNSGQDYVFGTNSQLNPAINSITVNNLTVDGTNLGNIRLDHGANGITQFADSNGLTKVNEISQNGFAAGELTNIALSDEGRVVASYTNGRTIDLAQVTLASFSADGFLQKLDGGAFRATEESGTPVIGAQGRIISSALESSNTDIADEFTKLIVTQQAYAANTRIISTSDEMIQEALNMIR